MWESNDKIGFENAKHTLTGQISNGSICTNHTKVH